MGNYWSLALLAAYGVIVAVVGLIFALVERCRSRARHNELVGVIAKCIAFLKQGHEDHE